MADGDARDVELGLLDPAAPNAEDRRTLIAHLREQGCTDDEMVAAVREDRLFALAGDKIVRAGAPTYSVDEAAATIGCRPDFVRQLWHAVGLPPLPDTGPVMRAREVEGLTAIVRAAELMGEGPALGVVRVAGLGLARLSEAEATAMRSGLEDVDLGLTGSETVTAVAWETVAALVPGVGLLLDAVHRRHLESARTWFETTEVAPLATGVVFGVGFADLSGFTAMSSTLPPAQLSKFMSMFEEAAHAVVHAGGGRVVKFLGDAVMFVTPTARGLGELGLALASDPRAAMVGMPVRVGLAHGEGIAHDGDYFGDNVNLAARLVAAAAPGEVLAAPSLAGALAEAGLAVEPTEARTLRGIAEPVTPLRLLPRPPSA